MGIFSGAHGDNTSNEAAKARGAQGTAMSGAAMSYSNYRVANQQARQAALANLMSLYQGPQNALGAISGGQGANVSRAGMSPFNASPGYFNIGRAGATGGKGQLVTDASGNFVGTGLPGSVYRPGADINNRDPSYNRFAADSMNPSGGGSVGAPINLQTGQGFTPPQRPGQSPFQYGRR